MKRIISFLICLMLFSIVIFSQTEEEQTSRTGTTGIPGLQNRLKSTNETADINIITLEENLYPEDLIQNILGTGIDIFNVQYTGSWAAAGQFFNGKSTGIEFESGIILTSGWAHSILGPNNVGNASNATGIDGDADLSAIIGASTYDASVLEFDFVPKTEMLTFNYVLFSEEYPEYLNYTDVFAFFLDGMNIALIPGTSEPVAIHTVNHLYNSQYYISNDYGNYNVQADGFTTVLTASALVTKDVTHHIKLAIADMGDRIYDSWVLIEGNSFSSLGTIAGTVYDNATQLPLKDVEVSASGYHFAQTPTREDGKYIILNLDFGYGYEVTAIAPGYQKKIISGINLLADHPVFIQDIYMEPISGNFIVESMNPDPNPEISVAMPNAKMVHRYYYVKNLDDNTPGAGIPVYYRYNDLEFSCVSDENGMVDVTITETLLSEYAGDEHYFEIYKVLNKDIDPTIPFTVRIVDAVYVKYWAESNYLKGSFTNFVGGLSTNSTTKLHESMNMDASPENLSISLGDNASFGMKLSVGPQAIVRVNDFTVGLAATANVQADAKVYSERGFQFNYLSQEDKEALAKYYLYSKANFGLLDNTLIRLGSVVEEVFINNYLLDDFYGYDKGGITLTGSGTAKAYIGTILPVAVNLSAGAEVSASVSFNEGIMVDRNLNITYYAGGEFSFDGSASTNMVLLLPKSNFTKDLEEKLSFFDNEYDVNIRRGISVSMSKNKVELAFVKRNSLETGWETIDKYIITGKDVIYYFRSIDLIGSVADMYEGQDQIDIIIDNFMWPSLTHQIFEILYALTNEMISGKLMVSYESYRSDFKEDEPLDLYVGLGLEALVNISASLGYGTAIEEGRSKMVEKGKWLNQKHLPLEEYNTYIPEIPVEQEALIQGIINDIPLSVRILIGAYQVLDLLNPLKSSMEEVQFSIGGGGSYLLIDPTIVPEGVDSIYCVSWGWYGDADATKSAALKSSSIEMYERTKKSAQELYKLDYGVGGFYQFEPHGLDLNGQATLVIKYADEELTGVDESKLAAYYEDKENHAWVYAGGTVNAENNEVTASISKLALYTLAPAIPAGDIILETQHDTLPADGVATTFITSNTLYYNNLTLVDDQEVYTVTTTNGNILNPDSDPVNEGIQVHPSSGILQVELQASVIGSASIITVTSVQGNAQGKVQVYFRDETKPGIPVLSQVEGFNSSVAVTWSKVQDPDLAGYRIYFDTDSELPPYTGVAKVGGSPSPITIGKDTSFVITNVFSDSTYFITVTAVDMNNNESEYSNVLSTNLEINNYPVVEDQEYVFTGLCNNETYLGTVLAEDVDGDLLSYSVISGKNSQLISLDEESGSIYLMTGKDLYDTIQKLIIAVKDNGAGGLVSTAIISLKTGCWSNHAPELETASFELVDTSMVPNHIIGQVEAYDEDAGQDIGYKIVAQSASDAVTIDPHTGEIRVYQSENLVFDENGEFVIKVVATDDGEGWLTDTLDYTITLRITVNQSLQREYLYNIYPNPTRGKVYISPAFISSEPVVIELYSLVGEKLSQTMYDNGLTGKVELDIEGLDEGVYIVKIYQSGEVVTGYIVRIR